MTDFRLVSADWAGEVATAATEPWASLAIACPFIKTRSLRRILGEKRGRSIRVLTRFNLDDFDCGVSDVDALELLLDYGAEVRGIKGLHAKVYGFVPTCVIATSANLTEAAMLRNHEFGFVARSPSIVRECVGYFDILWMLAGENLDRNQIDEWRSKLERARTISGAAKTRLGDFGANVDFSSPLLTVVPTAQSEAQTFVKFFGTADNREPLSTRVIDQLIGGSSHWACTYSRRPRQVRDGAIMFLSRMVNDNDYRIYGRAIGRAHREGFDEATSADLERLPWKSHWPYYVRVHDARCIDATLGDGISLVELMNRFGSGSFVSTSRNAAIGKGNTFPRKALMQQPQVEVTPQAAAWLSEQLEAAFLRHGTITESDARLIGTWPEAYA